MSEAVTTAEIEDVLSAVRKLVSENTEGEAQKGEAAHDDVSKLVLTPAFRVHDDAENAAGDDAESQDNAPHIEMAEVAEAAGDVEADVINLNTGETMRADETGDADDTDATVQDAQAEDAAQDASHHEAPSTEAEGLAARIAELEAVVARASGQAVDEYEPDGSEDVVLPDVALQAADSAQPSETENPDTAHPDTAHPDTAHPDTAHQDTAHHDTEIAETGGTDQTSTDQSAQADPAQDWEDVDPDQMVHEAAPEADLLEAEPYEDDESEDTPAQPEADVDAPDVTTEAAPEIAAAPQEGAAEEYDDDDEEMLLDEDTLREIVSRIVREELQGPMGERITQNLRRLVRREVKRALTMRGVE